MLTLPPVAQHSNLTQSYMFYWGQRLSHCLVQQACTLVTEPNFGRLLGTILGTTPSSLATAQFHSSGGKPRATTQLTGTIHSCCCSRHQGSSLRQSVMRCRAQGWLLNRSCTFLTHPHFMV